MSMFDMITRNIGDSAKKAAKKSGELVEITKLNIRISTEEDKARAIYEEIGKSEYQKYNKGEMVDNGINRFCEEIDELESGIRIMKRKLSNIKQTKKCQDCGTEVKKDASFCPKCGKQV